MTQRNHSRWTLLVLLSASLLTTYAAPLSADIVNFIFDGSAGPGLLAASEPGATGNGSGGILTGGVSFDTDTNELTMDVGWGSGNGFTNLTSPVSLLNIHGPTTDPAPDSYNQSGPGLFTISGIDPSPTSGGFAGTVNIPDDNVAQLMTGRLYLHIHTDTFGGGEARGYFIATDAVPEPGSLGLAGMVASFLLTRRNRPRRLTT